MPDIDLIYIGKDIIRSLEKASKQGIVDETLKVFMLSHEIPEDDDYIQQRIANSSLPEGWDKTEDGKSKKIPFSVAGDIKGVDEEMKQKSMKEKDSQIKELRYLKSWFDNTNNKDIDILERYNGNQLLESQMFENHRFSKIEDYEQLESKAHV